MNESPVHQPRRVIPRWRDFATTAALGELGAILPSTRLKPLKADLAAAKQAWVEFKHPITAGELLTAALVEKDWQALADVASYLLRENVVAPAFTKDIARHALEWSRTRNPFPLDAGRAESAPAFNPMLIGVIRRSLASFPHDAVYWVELALGYAIIGKSEKARRAILAALHLAPDDRFVLRSAARFFVHHDEPETAIAVLNAISRTRSDSWLLAAHLAVSEIIEKTSRFHKQGQRVFESHNIAPFHRSELGAALATSELASGNDKRSRKLFTAALVNPTENALAQALWARERFILDHQNRLLRTPRSYEANARVLLQLERWEGALKATRKWKEDEPFSARPASLGSFIAGFATEDHDEAIRFAKDGLIANAGDPGLLNNLAYSLACQNKTDEAATALRRIQTDDTPPEKVVAITATLGLIAFRDGKREEGRAKYLEAMEMAEKNRLVFHRSFAALHLAREEVRANSANAGEAVRQAEDLARDSKHPCICLALKKLRQDLSTTGAGPVRVDANLDLRKTD